MYKRQAEGCEVVDLHAPLRIEKDENGRVAALWVKPQMVGEIRGGRPAPVDSSLPEVRMECDRVLVAIGQGIDSLRFGEYGIPIKRGAVSYTHLSDRNLTANFLSRSSLRSLPSTPS